LLNDIVGPRILYVVLFCLTSCMRHVCDRPPILVSAHCTMVCSGRSRGRSSQPRPDYFMDCCYSWSRLFTGWSDAEPTATMFRVFERHSRFVNQSSAVIYLLHVCTFVSFFSLLVHMRIIKTEH